MRYITLLIFSLIGIQVFAQFVPDSLCLAAIKLTQIDVHYDPEYYSIDYPNGDIPANKGVCTDVIIRAYRLIGIDLQKEVHEDMVENFEKYPQLWGLSGPDKNIDHRRVPNLMKFFERYGSVKSISLKPSDFEPGDIVCWDLGEGVTHIGVVACGKNPNGNKYLIVHNIGNGQVMEDCLFNYKIIGHYRYPK